MSRNVEILSKRNFLSLTDEVVDNENLSEIEDEEMLFEGNVDMSDGEDVAIDACDDAVDEIDDESSDGSDDESDNQDDPTNSSDSTEKYVARDGTVWQKNSSTSHQTRSFNVVRNRCGPARITEMMSKSHTFKCYMSEVIVDIIVRHTNKKVNATYAAYNEQNPTKPQLKWKDVTVPEMYAFIGLLIMTGANHSNNDNTKDLWAITSYPLYRATMGINRFWALLRFIRFDDANTRSQRTLTDKAASIRDVWTMLNANLAAHYKPSENLTIDEQLFPYRGRTKFTQYIPSKPAKYGIKVWWICDAKNSYPLEGQIYTGKLATGREVRQGERVVKDLTGAFHGSGRNITMDNFFTTLALAEHLLSNKLTMVGTLRKNKPYIPDIMKADKKELSGHPLLLITIMSQCAHMFSEQRIQ